MTLNFTPYFQSTHVEIFTLKKIELSHVVVDIELPVYCNLILNEVIIKIA